VQLLFGTVSPEELIRTEKIRGAKRNATDFLSYFFPKENIWINEWF
jgi:predicted acetyltransferase